MRSGRVNVIGLVLVVALVVGGGWLYLFGPYYWDFLKVKELSKTVAYEWDALGEGKARAKLEHELQKRGMSDYIYPDDFLFQDRGGVKSMSCSYTVDVKYPLVDRYQSLSFQVTTDIKNGDVSQY